MTALTTIGQAPQGASAMIPRSIAEALELAKMMAQTGFLPRQIQTPGGALFVVEQAMRWNMSPFAVATEVSFISDKPMFSGKIVAAAVQSSGFLSGRLRYDYSGSGDDRAVTVSGTIRGEAEPREITVRLRDARTNNQMWAKQPDQQLAYFGARAWARRHTPEVMLGVYSPEEFDEPAASGEPRFVPNTAAAQQQPQQQAAPPQQDADMPPTPGTLPLVDPDGQEWALGPSPRTGAAATAVWAKAVHRALGRLEDAAAVRAWRADNGRCFGEVASISEAHARLVREAEAAIEARLRELAGPEAGPEDAQADPEWQGERADA